MMGVSSLNEWPPLTDEEIAALEHHVRKHPPPGVSFADSVVEEDAGRATPRLLRPLPICRLPRQWNQMRDGGLYQVAAHYGEWICPIEHRGTMIGTVRASRTTDPSRPWIVWGSTADAQSATVLTNLSKQLEHHDIRVLEQVGSGIRGFWVHADGQDRVRLLPEQADDYSIDPGPFIDRVAKVHSRKHPIGPRGPHPSAPAKYRLRRLGWPLLTAAWILGLVMAGVAIRSYAGHLSPTGGLYSLISNWCIVQILMLALCISAGYLVCGRPFGVLIDNRNRYSLARLQWLVWFTAIFGVYFTEALWNVGQGLELPKLSPDILKLLGFSTLVPVVSATIIDTKKNAPIPAPQPSANALPTGIQASTSAPGGLPAPAPPPGQPDQVGKIDVNTSPRDAGWQDLYMGEEVANRDVIDVSRLQQLVATLLVAIVFYGDASDTLGIVKMRAPLALPPLGNDLINLLGLSQAGYLAYKAVPKT
jgi:hypothetical protein